MVGESHEISEEKHVSRAESISTMPWQKHEASARVVTRGNRGKRGFSQLYARG